MKFLRKTFWRFLLSFTNTKALYSSIVQRDFTKYDPYKLKTETIVRKVKEIKSSIEYYNKRYSKLNKNLKFKDIPITDRSELKKASTTAIYKKYQRNLQKLNLNNPLIKFFLAKDFIFTMSTGGTSGSPLIVYRNKKGLMMEALLFLRSWKMMGYQTGDKVLIFYPKYYNYNLSWINKLSALTGIKLFFFNSFSKKTIKQLVKEINSFRPDFITTFPSYLNDAAMIIKREKLILEPILKGIEVSGEILFDYQRKNCKEIFKTEIYDSYGSLETGMIAHECKFHNGMHIYEDIVYPESLNNNLIFTRTNLSEMPIIRYKIGDLGKVIYEKCKCGISGKKLTEVEGRIEDHILLPNKTRIYPTSFRQILNNCNQKFDNSIAESNIIQDSKNNITLNVVLSNNQHKKEIHDYLTNNIKKILLQGKINLTIKFTNKIKRKLKFRFIERKI